MEEDLNSEIDITIKPVQKDDGLRRIAWSIIIGAALISASILFSGNLILAQLINSQDGQTNAGQTVTKNVVGSRDKQPTLGNSNAKVTMVEFGDFQCPFCQKFFNETFPQIKSLYIDTGKIKYVFRHLPLSGHVNAQISAVAAECANNQDQFWQYHDLLYRNGESDGIGLTAPDLKKYANSLGLNAGILGFAKNKFNQCLDANATLKTVQADAAEGAKDGVTGTPTFFINGKQVTGAQPFDTFQQAIEAALKS